MNLNKVIIVGRVTADPQLRTTPGGQSVVTIGVATNRTWTDKNGAKQEEAEFHNIVIWGKQAEVAAQYLTKGSTVLIEGRLRTRSWTDKQGAQHRTTEIMSERMQLGPRASGTGFSGKSSIPKSGDGDKEFVAIESEIPIINLEEEEVKPEDIPF